MRTQVLTSEEQANVRAAIQLLRARCGNWETVARALDVTRKRLRRIVNGGWIAPSVPGKVAKVIRVSGEDVLTGRFFPPGTCPHCGKEVRLRA